MANQGWVFTSPDVPLELHDLPVPIPGPGQVVLDVAFAGLCHSDVGILEGSGRGWVAKVPIVLGHEVAGTIREIGEGVEGFAVGDRVAVGLVGYLDAPGRRSETPRSAPGLFRDGGYERQVVAEASELVRVPDSVTLAQAATATDSSTTAYHAVMCRGGVTEGAVVGVIGLGGLGMNALQIAVAAGATVHGADINPGVQARGAELGAASTHADAASLAEFAPDVVLDFAGFGTTSATALEVVRPYGTVVQVGLGRVEATISTNLLVTKTISFLGSLGGHKADLAKVLDLIAAGTLTPTLEVIPFAQVPQGLQRLAKGAVTGRLVAEVSSA